MTTTSAAISQNAITDVVHRMLKQRSIDRQALPEEDLRDVGLSSLDMVELVLSVESELDLTDSRGRDHAAEFSLDRRDRCPGNGFASLTGALSDG